MPLLCIAMIVIRLLIVIIHRRFFDVCNGFMLIFGKLEQRFLPPIKEFHLWILIDFCLLGVIKGPRPSTIDCATYLTSDPYQSDLQF